jgi:SAM-dependent methyltransferase
VSTIESDYYSFMGFDPAAARAGLAHYAPFFAGLDPVLELACGRGEFLDVLRDAGVTARGVDLDKGMVEAAVASGHDVVLGDALEYLAQAQNDTYGGVFAAHFVEHLQPDDVLALCRSAKRALRPGGRLVLVTPNAASHSVMSYDFWRDPTHVRFYDPGLLSFFLAQSGFDVEEAGGNPRNDPGPPPDLWPTLTPASHPTLAEEVGEAVRAARKEQDMAHRLGHLLGVVAERLRVAEDALVDLRAAHDRLLRALYPPSEVYVVGKA